MTAPLEDLPPLDPRAAALLAAYRRGRLMPAASRARVQARILNAETCSSGHVVSFTARARSGGWAVALAVAAALVIWLARAGLLVGEDPGAPATMSPSHGSAAAQAPIVAAPPAEPAPVAAPAEFLIMRTDVEEVMEAEAPVTGPAEPFMGTDVEEVIVAPVPPRARPERPEGAALGGALDGLREETALLSGGWRALADGELDRVSQALAEHERRFPGGALIPERQALAALAACAEEPEGGRSLASEFLAVHPRSPLARRVREQCHVAP